MPRGAKPKVYDAHLVDRVRSMYASDKTQAEIAALIDVSQKVVWNLMRRHGILARTAAKRDQRREKNSYWKGSEAGYAAFHKRLTAKYGLLKQCWQCGSSDQSRTYDWANLTGHYEDESDYKRMCRSCHSRYDGKILNIPAMRKGGAKCPNS